MNDGVPRCDRVRARVDHRAVQRVQHRADKLSRRAGVDASVAVERENIAYTAQRVLFPRHLKLALFVAQQLCQLRYRPALALVRGIALPVEAARAREKIEPPAVLSVEARDRLAHRADKLLIGSGDGAVRLRQVGEQTERQRRALAAAGVVQLLQPLRARLRAEKRRDDAYRPPARRHAILRVHAEKPLRAHDVQQDIINKALHQLRHGQQKQHRRDSALQVKPQRQRCRQRHQYVCPDVQTLAVAAVRGEEVKADVPPVVCRAADEGAGVYVLLRVGAARKLLHTAEIRLPCAAVHARIFARRITAEHAVGHVGRGKERLRVQHGQQPQCGEQRFKLLCVAVRVGGVAHLVADRRRAFYHRRAQQRRDKAQFAPPQYRHGLEPLHVRREALLRHLAPPGQQQVSAQRGGKHPVRAQPQPPRVLKLRQHAAVFALYHVPVVQQPLACRRRRGHGAVAPRDLGVAAAQLAAAFLQPPHLRVPAALALRREQPRRRRGVFAELRQLDIYRGIYSIHSVTILFAFLGAVCRTLIRPFFP